MSGKLWRRNATLKLFFSQGSSHVTAFDSSLQEHREGLCDARRITLCLAVVFGRPSDCSHMII